MCAPLPIMAHCCFLIISKMELLFLCLRAVCISFSGNCSSHPLLIFLSGLIIFFISKSSLYMGKMSTFSLI